MEGTKMKRRSVIGRTLAELRRSSAAGLHRKTRRDRANTRRQAIGQDRRDSAA